MNILTSWMGFHVAPPPNMTYIAQHLTNFQAHNIPASWMGFHIAPDMTYIGQHLTTFQAHNIPASQIIVQF